VISFSLSEDQQLVQETVRRFAAEALRPRMREFEAAGEVPDALRRAFHELGVALVEVPEALGGSGLGVLTAALVQEELAWGDPGAAIALHGPHALAPALLELGTPEQAARHLRRFQGDKAALCRGAVAFSEQGPNLPEAGFHTTAHRDGASWVLDGEKAFVIHGGAAQAYVVFAQSAGTRGWEGLSAFVVLADQDGVQAGPRQRWLGLETVRASSVTFKGCRVADADRLSGAKDPVFATRRLFARMALSTAARQVGLARAAYETALAYTQERTAFGKPVAHFQAISFALADMTMDVDSARWMLWRAAAAFDRLAPGSDGADEQAKSVLQVVAMAATHANEASWRVADQAVQLLGGAGYIQDFPVEKWLRDSKALALVGGTDQLAQLCVAGHAELPSSALQPVVT
jgi:alkylation response protein AidB-like acyl-CoA dehydrogenase